MGTARPQTHWPKERGRECGEGKGSKNEEEKENSSNDLRRNSNLLIIIAGILGNNN